MERVKLRNHRFYVYEHWRPDKDICFYVGKGSGGRAYISKRGRYYNNVVKKLARLGLAVEIRIVKGGLREEEAHSLEIGRIAFWRDSGVKLTNKTDGGEGISGYKRTEDEKRRIGIGNKGKVRSEELKLAHSKKMRGRKISTEHVAALVASHLGKPTPEYVRIKIGLANKGKQRSIETRVKLRLSHLGKKLRIETRLKMGKAAQRRWDSISKIERQRHSENIKKGQENYNKRRCRVKELPS